MILELHERDTEVLEQILSILKNHPEIEKFEIDEVINTVTTQCKHHHNIR